MGILDSIRDKVRFTRGNKPKQEVVIAMHDYTPQDFKQGIAFTKGDRFIVKSGRDKHWWLVKREGNKRERGLVPSSFFATESDLGNIEWITFDADRETAERVLREDTSFPAGSFIIRSAARHFYSSNLTLSLSVKGKENFIPSSTEIAHYKIRRENAKFSIGTTGTIEFNTLADLVQHHAGRGRISPIRLTFSAKKKQMVVPEQWEYDESEITKGELLSTGHFGQVFKGTLGDEVVALKTGGLSRENVDELISEAELVRPLKHSYVLETIGICRTRAHQFIITEFMANGPLDEYIRQRELTPAQCISVSRKIACAMDYLEGMHIVHRHLSTKCIHVGQTIDIVKVSNFSCSLSLKDSSYVISHDQQFPVRWTAPEAFVLFEGIFITKEGEITSAADVWSFGVLMWELYINAQEPYSGVDHRNLYKQLTIENLRLLRPDRCPESIYAKMYECWNIDRKTRPTFSALHIFLSNADDSFTPSDPSTGPVDIETVIENVIDVKSIFSARDFEWISTEFSKEDVETVLMGENFILGSFIITTDFLSVKIARQGSSMLFAINHYTLLREAGGFQLDEEDFRFDTLTELVRHYADRFNSSPIQLTFSVKKNKMASRWDYDTQEIVVGTYLARGSFGEQVNIGNPCFFHVFMGKLFGKEIVALKKPNPRHMDNAEFMKEAEIGQYCIHENVLATIGICRSEMFMITEFMKNGSLKNYVMVHKLSLSECMSIALRIVSGMEYLASLNIVHRDLAARNVLVGESINTIKVADFGLARDLVNAPYYITEKEVFPHKWTAPEGFVLYEGIITTHRGKLSHASDVWSYGVVLWELFSNGQEPYSDIPGYQLYEKLTKGNHRLQCPEKCDKEIYDEMLKCWNIDRNARPTFSDLRAFLTLHKDSVFEQELDVSASEDLAAVLSGSGISAMQVSEGTNSPDRMSVPSQEVRNDNVTSNPAASNNEYEQYMHYANQLDG